MIALNANELDLETLSNINPFEDNKEIPSDLTECLLNNGCLETSQNSSLIDPLTNFEENKSTIFDDNQTQNMFKDNNFI